MYGENEGPGAIRTIDHPDKKMGEIGTSLGGLEHNVELLKESLEALTKDLDPITTQHPICGGEGEPDKVPPSDYGSRMGARIGKLAKGVAELKVNVDWIRDAIEL